MSKDFQTYNALRSTDAGFSELVPMTDLEELRRLSIANGLGEPIYDSGTSGADDEFTETLLEFGFGPPEESK